MKIRYQQEPFLKEEYVEVHFREESEKLKTIRDFFAAFQSIIGKKDFVRIGKSTAVNLYKVNQVKTDLNMKLRLLMDNGEILILNRTYKKTFLNALHHIREVYYESHQ